MLGIFNVLEQAYKHESSNKTINTYMKLSIVIPMYKVEQYIEKCLNSCLNQGNEILGVDYEIIIINDGSPDRSSDIAQRLIHNRPGCKIINQENKGLSEARNNGLKNAKGEYIWFIDSDDWIEPQSIPLIIDTIKSMTKTSNQIDLIQIGYRNVWENTRKETEPNLPKWSGIISGEEYMQHQNLPTPVQFNIYRRALLIKEHLYFFPGIYHEDIEFKPRVLYYCKNCICIENIVYNYLKRTGGNITSSFKLKNGLDLITTNKSLMKFIDNNSLSKNQKRFFVNRLGVTLNLILKGYNSLSSSERKILKNKILEDRKYIKFLIQSQKIKLKLEGYSLYLFPKISLKILTSMLRINS